ncbi:hypothetical protein H8R18_02170 [Nanchangia anserum]|uniref:Lipoprotein n=1 Tax=Nanchangia anserum TaxID=2692125 RepID=A0A8I0GEG9_9ACTO|nr:hypothetical protein [Nanchangia anserum]MBD3690018.1 hypothetical protein [Nanchangia anserum]QOX82183.1 hypothetical protein H8R18_02170 [Nanchangia anserum]
MKRLLALAAACALAAGLTACGSDSADSKVRPASSEPTTSASATESATTDDGKLTFGKVEASHDTPEGVVKKYMTLLLAGDYQGVCQQAFEPAFTSMSSAVDGCVQGMQQTLTDEQRQLLSSPAARAALEQSEVSVTKTSDTSATVNVDGETWPVKLVDGKWYLDAMAIASEATTGQ